MVTQGRKLQAIIILKCVARIQLGPKIMVKLPGDFIFAPPFVRYQKINAEPESVARMYPRAQRYGAQKISPDYPTSRSLRLTRQVLKAKARLDQTPAANTPIKSRPW